MIEESIQTIKDAEKEAEEILQNARKEAEQIAEQNKIDIKAEEESAAKRAKESKAQILAKAKEAIDAKQSGLSADFQKEADMLKTVAAGKEEGVIDQLMKEFL